MNAIIQINKGDILMVVNNELYRIAVFNGNNKICESPFSFSTIQAVDMFCTSFTNMQELIHAMQEICDDKLDSDNDKVVILRYINDKEPIKINTILYQDSNDIFNENNVEEAFKRNIKSPTHIYNFISRIHEFYSKDELESLAFFIKYIKRVLCNETSFDEVYKKSISSLEVILNEFPGYELCRIKYLSLYGDSSFDLDDEKIDIGENEKARILLQSLNEYMSTPKYVKRMLTINTEVIFQTKD
jgi:hypothetical protein